MEKGYEFELNPETGLTQDEIKEILKKSKAVMTNGHYELICGDHTSSFICFSRIAQWPCLVSKISDDMVKWIKKRKINEINAILTHANRSLVLAFDVAIKLNGEMNARIVEALIDPKDGQTKRELRAGHDIIANENVVLVASMTTNGVSIEKLISIVKEHKANLLAICLFATRNGVGVKAIKEFLEKELPGSEIPIYVILKFKGKEWDRWPKSKCEMCKEGRPYEESKDIR